MQKPKIIVTRRWPKPVEDRLAEHFDVTFNSTDTAMTTAQLQHALQHCDALLPTVSDAINANVLGVRPMQAKALGSYGVGFNHIDLTAARAAGLTVTNTPNTPPISPWPCYWASPAASARASATVAPKTGPVGGPPTCWAPR